MAVAVRDGGAASAPGQIAGVKVASARVLLFDGVAGQRPLMQQGVEVRFGKLTAEQFQALSAEFGGHSRVKFDAAREYGAVDFLPPALQALVHRDGDFGEGVKLPGTAKLREMGEGDYSIAVSPNCHGTAWEAMRAFQGPSTGSVALHYGEAVTADARYADENSFTTLGRSAAGQAPQFLSQLKPGDVVAFNRAEGELDYELLHSAVYAGGGLFFEKPDTELDAHTETPYRLVTWDQMKAPIADFLGEEPSATARRPRAALEPGLTAFSFDDGGKLEGWAKKKGATVGKPLVVELEMSMGGGVRAYHASAVETFKVTIGADGRGTID